MTRPNDITEQEWANLSEEEQAALSEEETPETPEDKPAEKPEEKPEDKPAETPEEKPEAPEVKPDEKPEEKPAEAAELEIPEVKFVPKPVTDLDPDLKARLDLETKKVRDEFAPKFKELEEQFDSGEISQVEFSKKFAELQEAQADRRLDLRDTIRAENESRNQGQQRWEAEQDAFFKLHPEYDHPSANAAGNVALHAALNGQLQHISAQKEHQGKSGIERLMLAKKEVDKLLGREDKGPAQQPASPRPKPGTSLSHVPPAGEGDVSEFTHLDALAGDALEDALAKLSESQRERYLAGR